MQSIQKYVISLGSAVDNIRVQNNGLPAGSFTIVPGVLPVDVPSWVDLGFT